MSEPPNIMNRPRTGMAHGAGMVIAGFVSMVAGLCMGAFLADSRADSTVVHGTRRSIILHLARMGPAPLRHAAMAAMADGIMTTKEERNLYTVIDQIGRTDPRGHNADVIVPGDSAAGRRNHAPAPDMI